MASMKGWKRTWLMPTAVLLAFLAVVPPSAVHGTPVAQRGLGLGPMGHGPHLNRPCPFHHLHHHPGRPCLMNLLIAASLTPTIANESSPAANATREELNGGDIERQINATVDKLAKRLASNQTAHALSNSTSPADREARGLEDLVSDLKPDLELGAHAQSGFNSLATAAAAVLPINAVHDKLTYKKQLVLYSLWKKKFALLNVISVAVQLVTAALGAGAAGSGFLLDGNGSEEDRKQFREKVIKKIMKKMKDKMPSMFNEVSDEDLEAMADFLAKVYFKRNKKNSKKNNKNDKKEDKEDEDDSNDKKGGKKFIIPDNFFRTQDGAPLNRDGIQDYLPFLPYLLYYGPSVFGGLFGGDGGKLGNLPFGLFRAGSDGREEESGTKNRPEDDEDTNQQGVQLGDFFGIIGPHGDKPISAPIGANVKPSVFPSVSAALGNLDNTFLPPFDNNQLASPFPSSIVELQLAATIRPDFGQQPFPGVQLSSSPFRPGGFSFKPSFSSQFSQQPYAFNTPSLLQLIDNVDRMLASGIAPSQWNSLRAGNRPLLDQPVPAACATRRRDFQFGPNNYMFSWLEPGAPRRDWFNARNYCRRQCMDLVSLETAEENEAIKRVLDQAWRQRQVPYVWTSGRICDFDGCDRADLQPVHIEGWFWTATGAKLYFPGKGFNNWGVNQPDNRERVESCVAFLNPSVYNEPSGQFTWHDIGCHYMKPFICEDNAKLLQFAGQLRTDQTASSSNNGTVVKS